MVDFLAGLVRSKKLNAEDVDLVWREGLERWILGERLTECLKTGGRDVDVSFLGLGFSEGRATNLDFGTGGGIRWDFNTFTFYE